MAVGVLPAPRRIALFAGPSLDVFLSLDRANDANPQAMRQRRETVEHPFGTMKPAWERHTSSPKRLKVASEMADVFILVLLADNQPVA